MTAEKKDTIDKVAAAVEEIEKAAAEGSPKKKAPAKKAATSSETAEAKPAKKKTGTKKPAAPKKKAAAKKPAAAKNEKTAETKPAAAVKKTAAPKKKPAKKAAKQLKITQVKSKIGFDGRQRKVLAGLGLGRIGKQVVRVDDPCIRGMVAKVSHLVTVEEVEA